MYSRYEFIKVIFYGISFCFITVNGFNQTEYEKLVRRLSTGHFNRDFMNNVRKVTKKICFFLNLSPFF